MSTGLDQIIPYLRIIGEHLLNGLILSAAIFLGSLFAFRLLFREQRWSASTRYQASLFLFLILAASPVLTVFKPVPAHDAPARPVPIEPSDRRISRIFRSGRHC